MNGRFSDRNLLLGIMALQMDFISRDELIKAMHDWTLDKARTLSGILVRNGALDPDDRSVLENLVERHVARHGGDPEKSLSSLEMIVPSRSTLELMDDPDIMQSLKKLGGSHTRMDEASDPELTAAWEETEDEPAGRFRIISLHDEGGLGSVFLARDGEVNREVALKRMKEEIAADPQYRARFVFEAEVTGNLEHPGIVPVYGKGEYSDGRPYYAMRFIRGDNLKVAVDRFHKDRTLKSDAAAREREFQNLLRRFLVVCETMSYAHSRGIIHRDLKPRNILLGPYGETLVVDWGMAKVVGHRDNAEPSDATLRPPSSSDIQATAAGSRVGTPAYMSPEQARGEVDRLGPATDIYSLGVTLYYMLTGRAPFVEQDLPEVLIKVEKGEFSAPREVQPGVDRALEAICLKAMKLLPQDRYGTCQALAGDLEHWLADQPVSAYPEPISTRLARWLRRRKQLVAAALVLLFLGLASLLYHDRRIATEKAATTAQLEMTREALRDLLDVAGRSLAFIPNTEGIRDSLAKLVLSRYQEFGEKFRTDPGIRLERAQVYRVIGGIGRVTGQFESARQSYNLSIELLEALCAGDSSRPEYWRWLSQALIDRGELYHMNGETSDAERDLRAAVGHAERMLGTPLLTTYQRVRAEALSDLAEILIMRDRLGDARQAADQAVALLGPLANTANPTEDTPQDRWLLAIALTGRGTAEVEAGRRDAASQDFDFAEEVLNTSDEHDDNAQFQVACVYNHRGELAGLEPTALAQAESQFNRAFGLLERLIATHELVPHFREELAVTLAGRAAVRVQLGPGHLADAERDSRGSMAQLENLIDDQKRKGVRVNPQYLSLLSRTLEISSRINLTQGRKTEAVKDLTRAVALMQQATDVDAARVRDRAFLGQIKSQAEALTSN